MEHSDINLLRRRLLQPLPGVSAQEKMMGRVVTMPRVVPDNARPSAVLCLLFPVDDELNVLLMKRREDNTAHSGQVSFPGGRYEEQDTDMRATALREANEEVGLLSADVDILSPLTSLYIPVSNFNVYPYLACTAQRPAYYLSENEVSYILEVPLAQLFDNRRKVRTDVVSPAVKGIIKNVNAYQLEDGTVIWGATAMILAEIEELWHSSRLPSII